MSFTVISNSSSLIGTSLLHFDDSLLAMFSHIETLPFGLHLDFHLGGIFFSFLIDSNSICLSVFCGIQTKDLDLAF
jgi:hypothetical protein